ncbi:probable cytochrome P450 311a1 [Vespa velutina]|uniref:probable cytochrome P450 311a1 n=1 Tax=Vespa velutina TaxID=202808 RepID=UPI001FB4B280|nr:probable cytochrome P450 311a1 [Vespa velutina]
MGKKFQTCAFYLNNFASNIIKEKKESMLRSIINQELKEENSDKKQKPRILLDYLFESSHEGRKYSEQDIRDKINTMVITGSDTSAVTISFVLLMLATFPHIQILYLHSATPTILVSQQKVMVEGENVDC